MKKKVLFLMIFVLWAGMSGRTEACTGITRSAADGSRIVARTIEWGAGDLDSRYVVVPRGYVRRSLTPDGGDGMRFEARYGYVGVSIVCPEFVVEGLNEAGLSAGLFYFPGYGEYVPFEAKDRAATLADVEVVAFVLGRCASVDQVAEALASVRIVALDSQAETVHWRFADQSGRQIVLEIVGGELHFYDNPLGVLTNSPGFEWQITNLSNYVNLRPGTAAPYRLGEVELRAFGAGSGMLGVPGDVTPPSRFVRAAFYQASAPQCDTGLEAVEQCFHILNNFDIPVGIEFSPDEKVPDIPSATQWTAVTDMTGRAFYYRTMYDSTIRCIKLSDIDFATVGYRTAPLDAERRQSVVRVAI